MKMDLKNPKGTRDFLPAEKLFRDEIVETIRRVFERYGFAPIETPVMERFEVLCAKFAAGEGSDAMRETFTLEDQGKRKLGLKYDLTVPLARVIGQNPTLKMPFKRYQIDRVYRDGPVEANRYREFLQCDVDTVGIADTVADAEIVALAQDVYAALGLKVEVRVNNRKLLNDLMAYAKIPEKKRQAALVAIDKLDKKSKKEVSEELAEAGLPKKETDALFRVLEKDLEGIAKALGETEGVKETRAFLEQCRAFGARPVFFPTLVRGFAYYTGPIFEAWSTEGIVKGSMGGGGRWDEMIGKFLGSKKTIPATGISFGIARILDALEKKGAPKAKSTARAYVIGVGVDQKEVLKLAREVRAAGISADLDFSGRNVSKNMAYANALGIPFVLVLGENELKSGTVTVKDMQSGKQETVPRPGIEKLKPKQ